MWALICCAVILTFVFATVFRKSSSSERVEPTSVGIADVPDVLAALSAAGKDGGFAVFLFGEEGEPPAPRDALNVQFSIERGRMGIDWVLIAGLNLAAQSRFVDFFEAKGRPVEDHTLNGVRELRVEGERLAELLVELLQGEFGVTAEQELVLLASGFDWPEAEPETES